MSAYCGFAANMGHRSGPGRDGERGKGNITTVCTRPATAAFFDCTLLAVLVLIVANFAHPQAGETGRWAAGRKNCPATIDDLLPINNEVCNLWSVKVE